MTATGYTPGNYNNAHNFVCQVKVTNQSGTKINGPLYLVVQGLPSGVSVQNKDGKTQSFAPLSTPYLSLTSGSLKSGATVSKTLQLQRTGSQNIKFAVRVLAGAGQP